MTGAVSNALAAGCTVLFAAGNGPDRSPWNYNVIYPANLASSDHICVGASGPADMVKDTTSLDGEFYWGSSYVGTGPDIVAPAPWSYTTDRLGANGYNVGGGIYTGDSGNYTHNFTGTSSSTPKVAGIAALLLSVDGSLTPGQVKQILMDTATDIDAPGWDDRTGSGRVDAYKALASIGFFITDLVPAATGSRMMLTFPTAAGETYEIGSRSDLTTGSWASPAQYSATPAGGFITTPISGTGSDVSVYVDGADKFYYVAAK